MSIVNIESVQVLDNPSPFTAPLRFDITYESLSSLEEDLEWRLVYVGSAEDESYDQELESVLVGPVAAGEFRFILEADPPDHTKIPKDDLLGATVIFLSCLYRDQEFVRIGYYVSNEYPDAAPASTEEGEAVVEDHPPQQHKQEQELAEQQQQGEQQPNQPQEPPAVVEIEKVIRNICAENPRVTKFPIRWDTAQPKVDSASFHASPMTAAVGESAAAAILGQKEEAAQPDHIMADAAGAPAPSSAVAAAGALDPMTAGA